MSWTVKPSRTQEITKRTEPYLSDEAKAKYEKDLIPRYPERRGALLPILHDLQHHERCIPHQAMVEVIIAGACLRACSNRSRTRAAPTPTNISTNSEPLIE